MLWQAGYQKKVCALSVSLAGDPKYRCYRGNSENSFPNGFTAVTTGIPRSVLPCSSQFLFSATSFLCSAAVWSVGNINICITIHRPMTSVLHFQYLPREMLELILLKSMVGIISVEWMANVRDNESVSGSYNLYETVSNKTWMSANISLKSVMYQWMHTRYLNRGVVLKQCKIESLNCSSRFIWNLYWFWT